MAGTPSSQRRQAADGPERDYDNAAYLKYTGPRRVDKAMHSLEGIVRGIAMDDRINDQELNAIAAWILGHQECAHRHPFNEVIARLNTIVADGIVDEEERADILWLCEKFSTENRYFNAVSSDMQRLQGMLSGIAADGLINEQELRGLQQWMDSNDHLRTCWPYDELESMILCVLQDGKIDRDEHEMLMQFFTEFSDLPIRQGVASFPSQQQATIRGVCAVAPDIQFSDRKFCFTGESERLTRRELAEQVIELGGQFSPNLTQSVDYLVVGAGGNPCWAYACYGRKVEAAVKLRKKGLPVLIVHEYDYWDAFEEYR